MEFSNIRSALYKKALTEYPKARKEDIEGKEAAPSSITVEQDSIDAIWSFFILSSNN